MNPEIRNAKIESTMLGKEDHGIMTCFLMLDYGGSGQGFGGCSLDTWIGAKNNTGRRTGTAYGMEFIIRVLRVLEVESWEKLPGKYCRVECDYGKVHAIGHITKDQWFRPESDLKNL